MKCTKTGLKVSYQKDVYKGKCKLDTDTLVIKCIKYMLNNISELPEEISTMKATQKMNEKRTMLLWWIITI